MTGPDWIGSLVDPAAIRQANAANISYNLLRVAAGHGLTLGSILLGPAKPAHIVTP